MSTRSARTGQRQGELFGIDAKHDIDFLRRVIHVRRQVKIIRGKQVFAPIKNDQVHDVPLTDSHMMPDDRERARKAMERFFTRPESGDEKASGGRNVR